MRRNKVIVIVGPTASGKSSVALELARKADGEIVNADSRQIYQSLDAGTAKPTPEERAAAPHHLYDFLDPKQSYNAGDYARDAAKAIQEILSRKRRPIVVGGTGLYLTALFEGLSPLPQRDETIRKELKETAEQQGKKFLHDQLNEVDPVSAGKIPFQNIQRVIRALEVHRLTGVPLSELQKKPPKKKAEFEPAYFGIQWDRPVLKKRIEERTEKILPLMTDEARRLLERGYQPADPGLESLGYQSAIEFIHGRISRDDFFNAVLTGTLQYAKRQMTWFRRNQKIHWFHLKSGAEFDPSKIGAAILDLI